MPKQSIRVSLLSSAYECKTLQAPCKQIVQYSLASSFVLDYPIGTILDYHCDFSMSCYNVLTAAHITWVYGLFKSFVSQYITVSQSHTEQGSWEVTLTF